jgi:hypothetical protein
MGTINTTPSLSPEILADDAATAARIDQLLGPDPRYRQHVRAIRRAQEALRGMLADREWGVYLDLESEVNARFAYVMSVLVRWAFRQGQEHAACAPR